MDSFISPGSADQAVVVGLAKNRRQRRPGGGLVTAGISDTSSSDSDRQSVRPLSLAICYDVLRPGQGFQNPRQNIIKKLRNNKLSNTCELNNCDLNDAPPIVAVPLCCPDTLAGFIGMRSWFCSKLRYWGEIKEEDELPWSGLCMAGANAVGGACIVDREGRGRWYGYDQGDVELK